MLCVFHSCLYVRLFYCMCCCDLLYVLSHLGCFLYLVSFTSCDYVFFYVCCLLFSFAVAIPRPLVFVIIILQISLSGTSIIHFGSKINIFLWISEQQITMAALFRIARALGNSPNNLECAEEHWGCCFGHSELQEIRRNAWQMSARSWNTWKTCVESKWNMVGMWMEYEYIVGIWMESCGNVNGIWIIRNHNHGIWNPHRGGWLEYEFVAGIWMEYYGNMNGIWIIKTHHHGIWKRVQGIWWEYGK